MGMEENHVQNQEQKSIVIVNKYKHRGWRIIQQQLKTNATAKFNI